jgi:RNA-directed DNA polymerase
MRREESDGRVVPHGRRKAVPTAHRVRGGKATTASKRAGQRDLFLETADSPQGAVPGARTGQPAPRVRHAVPKSRHTPGVTLPAMTMEEVASDDNLRRAFEEVAKNRCAPGPDGRSVDEVRAHLNTLLPMLRRRVLDGTYRPGMIRRV